MLSQTERANIKSGSTQYYSLVNQVNAKLLANRINPAANIQYFNSYTDKDIYLEGKQTVNTSPTQQPPTNIVFTTYTTTPTSLTLSWTGGIGATEYIFIMNNAEATPSIDNSLKTQTITFLDLSSSSTYEITVIAINSFGNLRSSPIIVGLNTVFIGMVSTFAGSGATGPGGGGNADGTGTNALFRIPNGIAVDSSGNLYVVDTNNNSIRKITPAGVVTTIAGSPTGAFGHADGTGTNATFYAPQGIVVDSSGNLYVADQSNHRIRKITPAGVVTTFAGSTTGAQGSADGTGTNALFEVPRGIAVDSSGNLYVSDFLINQNIRKITPAGVVTTFAGSTTGAQGSADGTGTLALFRNPYGIAIDSSGNLYVADTGNNSIRKITPAGVVTTFAGSTTGAQGSTDGTGTNALFRIPYGIAIDSSGNLYVADSGNNRIRKITSAGVVTTIAGSVNGYADGTGTNALFYAPRGIAVDSLGNLYVADSFNSRIRKIT